MSDEFSIGHAIVTGMTTATVAFFGFIGKRFIKKVDETAVALAKHEKEDLGKYATTEQLVGVHRRIDESAKSAEDNFRELRATTGEIKNLIIQGLQK